MSKQSKTRRLNLLARLSALKTQSTLTDLNLRQQLLQQQQSSHSQLQSYLEEYLNRQLQSADGLTSVQISTLKNNSRFMIDLNYAVTVQQQQLKTAEFNESQSRSTWSRSYAEEQRWQNLERAALRDQNLDQDKKQDQENLDIWSARHSLMSLKKL